MATYQGQVSVTTAGAVQTFTAQPVGTADPDRWVYALGSARGTAGVASVGVTIGGVTATVDQFTGFTGTGNTIWAARALVPTGTTADVVVTYNASVVRGGIGIWTHAGTPTMLGKDTYAANTGGGEPPVDYTFNVPAPAAGGFILASSFSFGSGTTVTWINATERYDVQYHTSGHHSGADGTSGVRVTLGAVLSQAVSYDIGTTGGGEDMAEAKVHDGSTWVDAPVKVHDGTSWVQAPIT